MPQSVNPAEKQRGLAVRVKMDSQKSITDAGFTIVGTPAFSNNGLVFDGTTTYLTANPKTFESNNFQTTGFTVRWKAKIASADLGTDYMVVCDTSTGAPATNDGFFVLNENRNGVATNAVSLNIATVTALNRDTRTDNIISFATDVEYVYVYNGVTSQLYKNGVATAAGTVYVSGTGNYTPNASVSTIGAVVGGAGTKFKGTMYFLETWTNALTAQEVLDLYNNATFTYTNKAVLDLPMDMASYDPTNKLVLDRSGKGSNFEIGDKSTATTFPTKLATEGFSFDAGDYLKGTQTGLLAGATQFSLSIWQNEAVKVDYAGILSSRTAGSANKFLTLNNEGVAGTKTFQVSDGTANSVVTVTGVSLGQWHHLVGTWVSGEKPKIYVDGVMTIGGSTFTSSVNFTPNPFYVGADEVSGARRFNGSLAEAKIYAFALTPLQVLDLYLTTRARLTKI